MKVLKGLLIVASFVALVLGFIFNHMYLWICGIPALLFMFVIIHEIGHVIACKMVNTKVNHVEAFGFVFYEKFEIKPNLSIFGKVNFNKTNKDKFIFGFGIIVSVIITIITTLLFTFNLLNLVYFITICVCMISLLIPLKNSDIRKVFERR